MSDFADKFLQERRKLFAPKGAPSIYLGSFGKHPGWDDHMEYPVLETESLQLAKQVFYIEGIGGQINSGEWEKLDASQRLPAFKHVILWKRGEAFLLGKMWSSTDGKGRSRYPMIVCAECQGISLSSALAKVLPVLEEFERLCQRTESADEVHRGVEGAAEKLRALAVAQGEWAAPENDGKTAFIEQLGPAGDEEMCLRVLYRLDAQLPLGTARLDDAEDLEESAARIRLPALPNYLTDSLRYWISFFEAQFGTRSPILTTVPVGERWLDVVIGKPMAKDFYALLARPEAFAIASEVAYQIDAPFREEMAATVQTMRDGAGWSRDNPSNPAKKRSWISKLLSQD